MNRLLKRVLSAATIACLASSPVRAATLEFVQGKVMVNHGGGYRFVSGSVNLKPGDMIVADSGGSAQLFYDGGCTVLIEPGAVVTVAELPPCLTTQATPSTLGLSPEALAIGAVAIGTGVVAVLLLSNGSDKAASP